jgi:parvulin-like peptidyl-prolyl isomerase
VFGQGAIDVAREPPIRWGKVGHKSSSSFHEAGSGYLFRQGRLMRATWLLLLAASLVGCESTSVSGDPVAPPPPLRIGTGANLGSNVQPMHAAQRLADGPVEKSTARQVASNQPALRSAVILGDVDLADETLASQVVARVGGQVVFARECLESVQSQVEQARGQLPSEAQETLLRQLIRQELPKVIERKLLAAEAGRHLAEPQMKLIRQAADREFQKKLRAVMQQSRSTNESELAAALREQGLDIEHLRKRHEEEFLAQQYARAKLSDSRTLSRRDLIDHYKAHRDAYARPARVKWQHIEASAATRDGRAAARRKADELASLLAEGADFGLLARWKSDGPTAVKDGHWDWTTRGSLAARRVDEYLFQGKVGSVSPVIEGPDGYHIVKILDREPDRFVSFAEAQDEIRETLARERLAEASRALVTDLFATAQIETIFDDDPTFLASLPHAAASRAETQR